MNIVLVVIAVTLAQANDRVIGLVALPGVFGEGPCKPFEPRAPTRYVDADAKQVMGTIEVDQNWSFAPHGGCEGGQPLRVIENRRVGDRLWLHVEVFTHSSCDAGAKGPPEAIARGWLLAHAETGEPAVWFSSRGC